MTLGKLLYTTRIDGPAAIVRDSRFGCNSMPEIYCEEPYEVEGYIEEEHPELLGYEVSAIGLGNNRNINETYLEIALLDWEGLE